MVSLRSDLVLPNDGIKLQLANVGAFIGEKDLGKGFLCISENELIWRMEDGKGLLFNYPQIALHAISTDLNAFPHECLYMIADKSALNSSEEKYDEENEDEEEDSDEISPIRFVPEDKTFLQPLFRAINECQALHPDPEDDMSGEEEDEEDDEEEGEEEEGQNDFRDAEEGEEGVEIIDTAQEFDPNSVQLSARGRQIWQRLNRNANNDDENKNDNNEGGNDDEQFQDADISEQ